MSVKISRLFCIINLLIGLFPPYRRPATQLLSSCLTSFFQNSRSSNETISDLIKQLVCKKDFLSDTEKMILQRNTQNLKKMTSYMNLTATQLPIVLLNLTFLTFLEEKNLLFQVELFTGVLLHKLQMKACCKTNGCNYEC